MSTTTGASVVLALDDHALERLADLVADRLRSTLATSTLSDDRWLGSKAAADYLGLTLDALHRLTSNGAVSFSQDTPGGKLWFRRADLDTYRERGRRAARPSTR